MLTTSFFTIYLVNKNVLPEHTIFIIISLIILLFAEIIPKAILNLIYDGKFTSEMSLRDKLDLMKQETRKMLHDEEVLEGLEEED